MDDIITLILLIEDPVAKASGGTSQPAEFQPPPQPSDPR